MPEYLSPGVYVEEISSGIAPIEGVGTSTGAFMGVAQRGPIGGSIYEDGPGQPVLCANFTDFTRAFGSFQNGEYLAYAVRQFFGQGGTRCYVTRSAHFGNPGDPSTLTAKRAGYPLGGIATTLSKAIATTDTTVSVTSAAGLQLGMILFITDGTNSAQAQITNIAGTTLTVTPLDTSGNPLPFPVIANGAKVTQVALQIHALNEGAWGNDVLVSVSASGRLSATTTADLTAGATVVPLSSLAGLGSGMSLFITDATTAAQVQILRLQPDSSSVAVRYISTVPTVTIKSGAAVSSTIPGLAATSLALAANAGDGQVTVQSTTGIGVGTILWFVNEDVKGAKVTAERAVVTRTVGPQLFLRNPLTNAYPAGASTIVEDFTVTVWQQDVVVETYPNLSMEEANVSGFIESQINLSGLKSKYIRVRKAPLSLGVPAPALTGAVPPAAVSLVRLGSLVGTLGVDGDPEQDTDFIGDPSAQTGFYSFDTVADINIVAAPGGPRSVVQAGMAYCQGRTDCFFVGDVSQQSQTVTDVLDFKNATGAFAGKQALNSEYGALYFPWLQVLDPLTGRDIPMPPSGAVAGVYSNTDVVRGVHKAPAGIVDGFLQTADGIVKIVTKGEQDLLNPEGVDVIRVLPEIGIVVFGARTTSADPEWRYVNVRRLFIFLEQSIKRGTQNLVFEPNDSVLWARIRRNIGAFLKLQWMAGALVGDKPEQAYFVKCDAETNPPESVDAGRVITIVGVAPSRPAEFVIFRIEQFQAGAPA